jgi:hypothetical protein
MNLPGDYVFRFGGYDRQDRQARYLVGIGKITLNRNGTLTGEHYATNSPMWGQVSAGMRLRNSTYTLEGTYQVLDAGPPMRASAKIRFQRKPAAKGDPIVAMRDTMLFMQAGPDRFWLISSDPRDDAGQNVIDECVLGEAIKVDSATW